MPDEHASDATILQDDIQMNLFCMHNNRHKEL